MPRYGDKLEVEGRPFHAGRFRACHSRARKAARSGVVALQGSTESPVQDFRAHLSRKENVRGVRAVPERAAGARRYRILEIFRYCADLRFRMPAMPVAQFAS